MEPSQERARSVELCLASGLSARLAARVTTYATDWLDFAHRVIDGDRVAFVTLSRLITGFLKRGRALDFQSDWDDIAQEVVMTTLEAVGKGQTPHSGALVAFVRTVTRRRFVDRLRANQRETNDAATEELADEVCWSRLRDDASKRAPFGRKNAAPISRSPAPYTAGGGSCDLLTQARTATPSVRPDRRRVPACTRKLLGCLRWKEAERFPRVLHSRVSPHLNLTTHGLPPARLEGASVQSPIVKRMSLGFAGQTLNIEE